MYAAVLALAVCQWGGWDDGFSGGDFRERGRLRLQIDRDWDRPSFGGFPSQFSRDPVFRVRPTFLIEPRIVFRPRYENGGGWAGGGGCYQRPVPFANGYGGYSNGFAPRQRSWGVGVGLGVGGFRRDGGGFGFARGGG